MTDLAAIAESPSLEEVFGLMRQDGARGFRIDIETDSTIAVDDQAEKQALAELVQGLGTIVQGAVGAAQSGILPPEAAKELVLAVSRRFKLGRQFEDILDQVGGQPVQQQPDPKVEAERQRLQLDEQRFQMQQQMDQQAQAAKLQLDQQKQAADLEMERARATADIEVMRQRMQAEMALKAEEMRMQAALKAQEAEADIALDAQRAQTDAALKRDMAAAQQQTKVTDGA